MPNPDIKQFFIRATNPDGENLDLLVRAASKEEAERWWRAYYDIADDSLKPLWSGIVPDHPKRGPIAWHDFDPTRKTTT